MTKTEGFNAFLEGSLKARVMRITPLSEHKILSKHARVISGFDICWTGGLFHRRLDAWMRIVEVTIDGRGKMGSLVGASEEVRSGGIEM